MTTIPRDASVAADSYLQPWLVNRWRIGSLDWVPFGQFPGETPDYLATQEPGPDAVEAPLYPWLQRDTGDNPLLIPRFAREEVTPDGGVAVWRRRAGEDVAAGAL